MTRLVFATAALSALLGSAGLARADEPAPDPNAPATPPEPNATPAPAATSGAWPASILDRPLVLNKGMIDGHAALTIVNITIPAVPPLTMSSSSTAEFLAVGADFGAMSKLEVGADYFAELHPNFEAGNGPLILHAAYEAVNNGKLSIAGVGQLGFNFGTSDVTAGLGIGASVRYKITPKLAIFSPANQLNFGSLLAGSGAAAQLTIGLSSPQPIALNLPVGVEIQATPEVYASVATDIANIAIKEGSSTFLFSDFIPLNANLFFTAMEGKLDLGVGFADDLKHAGDAYAVTFLARFFKI